MLYNDKRGEIPILFDEVRAVINTMKKGKEAGDAGIVNEIMEATGEFGIRTITNSADRIYGSGYFPEAMRESVFIVIPKKSGALECSKHRTISIISQLVKALLRVVVNQLRGSINDRV